MRLDVAGSSRDRGVAFRSVARDRKCQYPADSVNSCVLALLRFVFAKNTGVYELVLVGLFGENAARFMLPLISLALK